LIIFSLYQPLLSPLPRNCPTFYNHVMLFILGLDSTYEWKHSLMFSRYIDVVAWISTLLHFVVK
jgi:hypothetical protein